MHQTVGLVKPSAVCATWNGDRVKTFDGLVYTGELVCSHILVEDNVDKTFAVVLKSCLNDQDTCTPALEVTLNGETFEFRNDNEWTDQVEGIFVIHSSIGLEIHINSAILIQWDWNVRIFFAKLCAH